MNKFHKVIYYIAVGVFTFFAFSVLAQPNNDNRHRIELSLNSNWSFYKGSEQPRPEDDWQTVSLPHSWNTDDVLDDEPGYYRGIGWYKKNIHIPESYNGKDVYLKFLASSQETRVYINGKEAGHHIGGYSTFHVKIDHLLDYSPGATNELLVEVDNSYNDDIPPLSADFTFYGGIYRDVFLVVLNKMHFDMDNYGSDGIFISTPNVSETAGEVHINGKITNNYNKRDNVNVIAEIKDKVGKTVVTLKSEMEAHIGKTDFQFKHIVDNPHLWSPDDPYLYTVTTKIVDAKGQLLDQHNHALGFRWFSFDAKEGFFLNGKHLMLIGTSRHQDYPGMGNALPVALHVRDVELVKEMGGNFLRVAHYPQDRSVMETCDRLGILTSVETPIVDRITESQAFSDNCKLMQIEMVRQNYNHPSVIMWSYMNEVLLRPRFNGEPEKQEPYLKSIYLLAKELDSLTRAEDPYRYTMLPAHYDFDLYHRTGLTSVPQVMGWNLYRGWYSPYLSTIGDVYDEFQEKLPDMPFLVTEYGADGDPRVRNLAPYRYDKSVEYETIYHKEYLKQSLVRPHVAGMMVWNLNDFNSEIRGESMPHVNNKGILTGEREPKDTYLYYQSQLLQEPFLKIGSRSWTIRSGIATDEHDLACVQPVEIFTNQSAVELTLNGVSLGTKTVEEGAVTFDVPFVSGINQLSAISKGKNIVRDAVDIKFKLVPQNLKNKISPLQELNVNVGDDRMMIDKKLAQVWLPEKPYEPNSWGYIGGEIYVEENTNTPKGTDRNILGTEYDPLFQTQRTGIEQFKFDVLDGKYELILHFAELLTSEPKIKPAHLLTAAPPQKPVYEDADREFDVWVNDKIVIENLSNSNDLKPLRVHEVKIVATAENDKGLTVDFKPLKDKTILSAIQLRRIN